MLKTSFSARKTGKNALWYGVKSKHMEVIPLRASKRRAMILSTNLTLAVILLIALVGLAACGYLGVGQWKAHTAATQARAIDGKLIQYADAHQTVRGQDVSALYINVLGNDHYRSRPEYPAAISNNGTITEHDKGNLSRKESTYGYMTSETSFTDNPKAEPYKFHYIPRTLDGSEWNTGMGSEPISYYTVEYYTKDIFGHLTRHVSPHSYENLKD